MEINGIFSESFWYVAPILMAITVFVAGGINNSFKIKNPIWKQVVSWITGAILSLITYFGGGVEMGDPTYVGVIALIVVVGLSSNGVYDIPTIKNFIQMVFGQKK